MKFSVGSLEDVREQMRRKVNGEAGAIRSSIVTLDPGMPMVYSEKRREAENYFASNGTLGPAETPHITAEAEKFGETIAERAQVVIYQAHMWAQLSAQIDTLRVWHEKLINDATTLQEITEAGNVDWSVPTSYIQATY